MKRFAIASIVILLLTGCIREVASNDQFQYRLVMDGRIEQDKCAVIMLSQNIPYRETYDEDTIREMVLNWATVSIIHNGEEEYLTGSRNKDYPTQYIYKSYNIFGEVGEEYTIRVKIKDQVWEATTTILEPIELSDVEIVAMDEKNFTIEATLPATNHPCSIDCSIGGSSYFAPTLLGLYEPSTTPRRITINRPLDTFIREGYSTYFTIEDKNIRLRVNTLTDFAYTYWRGWEDNFINSINPIFPSTSNLPTNLSNDGMGIWAGYGTSYHKVQMTTDSDL